jgi:hypothetical protein
VLRQQESGVAECIFKLALRTIKVYCISIELIPFILRVAWQVTAVKET